MLAFLASAFAWLVLVYPRTPQRLSAREISVRPSDFSSVALLNDYLFEQHMIEHPLAWRFYTYWVQANSKLRKGNTVIDSSMSPVVLLRHLCVGYGPAYVKVTMPEGFDVFDMAKRLDQRGVIDEKLFLQDALDRSTPAKLGLPSVEGYLFPDTYEFALETPPIALLEVMVGNWRKKVMPLMASWVTSDQKIPTPESRRALWPSDLNAIVTLASIVQKEARMTDEMSRIAGVFINRLTRPEFDPARLQSDPTIIYGCKTQDSPACTSAGITRAMLNDSANTYNTYTHVGLPPTPICNPGLSALRAALQPARHDEFYFVADGHGRHIFAKTYEAHQAAVKRMLRH